MAKKMIQVDDPKSIRSITTRRYILRGKPGTRLVVSQFTEKAKREIRDKHAGVPKGKKEKRDPHQEFLDARYIDEKGRECISICALKKAIVSAAASFSNLTKVGLRQTFFVMSTDNPAADLLPIFDHEGKSAVGIMREDAVTIGIDTRGLAYRPEYPRWQFEIDVEFNERMISKDQLDALVEHAGWGVGVCEGRPEKASALGWGRFNIVAIDGKPTAVAA